MKQLTESGDSRRRFLRTLGAGVAAFCIPSIFNIDPARGQLHSANHQRRFVLRQDRFGRMFPQLPPFAEPSRKLSEVLLEIGKPGGIMDAKDNLEAGPVQLIVNDALNIHNPDNTLHTAGTTFMASSWTMT
jgi:hypothetical protein